MTSIALYSIAFISLLFSFINDKEKSIKGLKTAWKSFKNLMPSVISVMLFVGITLSLLDKNMISSIIGAKSGILGVAIALILGSITLIPSFVAFPLGGALLNAGAGYAQIAAFVSTVMAVGIITLPIEIKYFNKNFAIKRNIWAFFICVTFTVVIGVVM
ncbi:MAG: hypothetical protein AB7E42_06010 [Anaerotignaceae bacterium]